jgi:hypothetical protein
MSAAALRLKVWGGTCQVTVKMPGHHNTARVIVSASSQKRAVALLNEARLTAGYCTLGSFRDYWSETGNALELSIASGREGIWYAPDTGPRDARDSYTEFRFSPT